MYELLTEYQLQFENECNRLIEVETQINNLDCNSDNYDYQLNRLLKKRNDINYFKSNLNYTIKWLSGGHEPGKFNGIENNKAYRNKGIEGVLV